MAQRHPRPTPRPKPLRYSCGHVIRFPKSGHPIGAWQIAPTVNGALGIAFVCSACPPPRDQEGSYAFETVADADAFAAALADVLAQLHAREADRAGSL